MPKVPKTIKDARRAIFSEYGYVALESVITGRVGHSTAIQTLSVLRDLLLDRTDDPRLEMKVKKYFSEHKMLKNTDFSYFNE